MRKEVADFLSEMKKPLVSLYARTQHDIRNGGSGWERRELRVELGEEETGGREGGREGHGEQVLTPSRRTRRSTRAHRWLLLLLLVLFLVRSWPVVPVFVL
jgi:hypothetical protein